MNARSPIEVTESGIVIFVTKEQLQNVYAPIEVIPSCKVTSVNTDLLRYHGVYFEYAVVVE